jgi:hypothetical protein
MNITMETNFIGAVLLKKKMILLPYFGAPPMSNYY